MSSLTDPRSHVGSHECAHTMLLFDDAASRISSLAQFIIDGVKASPRVIVVTSTRFWHPTVTRLQASGFPITSFVETGVVTWLDSVGTLTKFMRAGVPDEALFELAVGSLVSSLSNETRGLLPIYGDMVDVLAEQQDFAGAVRLEVLWNALAERVPFSLVCGYSALHFVQERNRGALARLCQVHSRTDTPASDLLGQSLLVTV